MPYSPLRHILLSVDSGFANDLEKSHLLILREVKNLFSDPILNYMARIACLPSSELA